MSKKNKDIEVRVEEEKAQYNGANVLMTQLFIGKKDIGRVIPQTDKKFIIEIDGKQAGRAKNLDEACEIIIRQWKFRA
ncbi:DUF2969 domain-containing protein [Enterococcus faecalis]|nr:DUF2969 domain-containing protein [Enterococcus faecalis]